MCAMHLCCHKAKWPNLKLKTLSRQLLGNRQLAFALPSWIDAKA
jgi:UDP-3-O-[3-hydroxymyristoyl] glucosamine N-acyltransferase